CGDNKIDLARVTRSLETLPPCEESRNWNEVPLYHLIDFLAGNHREFRTRYIPNITRMLEALKSEFGAESGPIEDIISEFNGFRNDFSWHMQEEEDFVFPKILRTEACLHHPEMYSEVFKGSVAMYPKSNVRAQEEAFSLIIGELTEKLKGMIFDLQQLPMVKDILTALQNHDAGLKAHAFLETDILFPRAVEIEKKLLLRAQAQLAIP
ncbi:MAG: hypothetical protein ABI036_08175, partial [Fibrobacteria bacterium]